MNSICINQIESKRKEYEICWYFKRIDFLFYFNFKNSYSSKIYLMGFDANGIWNEVLLKSTEYHKNSIELKFVEIQK